MWQIFSLLGSFSNALENVLDKSSLTTDEKLDNTVVTFVRVFIFTVLLSVPGFLGFLGGINFYHTWSIMIFGLISALYSYSYTYALERIEVTTIGTIVYVGPVVYLLIDTLYLGISLSLYQFVGVLLLVIGGIGFSLDSKTYTLKKGLSFFTFSIFIFWLAYSGIDSYFFKHLHTEFGLNGLSYLLSIWFWATIFLFILLLIQGKMYLVFSRSVRFFAKKSIISKSCDSASMLFETKALTLASVSQVSAMGALSPLMLFITTVIVQGGLKMKVGEDLSRQSVIWKATMIGVLIVGGFLVR